MKAAICKFKSDGPYSQGRPVVEDKIENESEDARDDRQWRSRMHVNQDGYVIIPPMAFANSLKEAAKYLSISVPGKGKSTYTKNFDAGVMVAEPLVLNVKAKDVTCERLFVPSDGRRGGGKRVWRRFPLIQSWAGTVTYFVTDTDIPPEIFERVVKASGLLIGIGRFRPRNCGYYGRFQVEALEWKSV